MKLLERGAVAFPRVPRVTVNSWSAAQKSLIVRVSDHRDAVLMASPKVTGLCPKGLVQDIEHFSGGTLESLNLQLFDTCRFTVCF